MTDAQRRLLWDFQNLQASQCESVSASPNPNNIFEWNAVILGPDDTEWKNGIFKLVLTFPTTYPQFPPTARFITPVFHPNISSSGNVCLDTLNRNWTPIHDVWSILISIQSLLINPNPASSLNREAADLWVKNREAYKQRVRATVDISQRT
jgi:ubiquitin-protein ligase